MKQLHCGASVNRLTPALRDQEQLRRTLWVTGVGAVVNLLLAVGKISVGLALSVQAVFADGVHSLSDLLSDGILLLFVRLSHRPRSRTRPYGIASGRAWPASGSLSFWLRWPAAWSGIVLRIHPPRQIN